MVTFAKEQRGKEIAAHWRLSLQNVASLYETPAFSGLVAFLGMQNGLWPMWLDLCVRQGVTFQPKERVFRLDDPEMQQNPWFCIFNPIDPGSSWVHVKGYNLPESTEVLPDLAHKDFDLTIQTMTADYKIVAQGRAEEVLRLWGIVHDWQAQGELMQVFLPYVQVEQLLDEWPLWQQSVFTLQGLMEQLVRECVLQGCTSAQLRSVFHELMDVVWSAMQEDKLITCAPFGQDTVMRFLGLRKKPNSFNGILVLLGDHQKLWMRISA